MAVKGFVLIVDVIIATMLLGIFVVIITYELSIAPQPNYVFKSSSDLLLAMDKAGILKNISDQSDVQAQNTLKTYANSLPANVRVNFTVNIYRYSNGFNLYKSINYAQEDKSWQISSVRRVFVNPISGDYGIAYMEAWYA